MNEVDQVREELEVRKDTDRELDGFEEIRGRARPGPRAVVSVRMSAAELREITGAAAVLGRNVSEFIREAALKDARITHAGIAAVRKQASA